MVVFSIFVSIIFAITFPIFLTNKAFVFNPVDSATNTSTIQTFFGISGFYLFLFLGLIVVSTIMIPVAKKKAVKYGCFAVSIISFSYYLFVFMSMINKLDSIRDSVADTVTVRLSIPTVIILILFILMTVTSIITLSATAFVKENKEDKKA